MATAGSATATATAGSAMEGWATVTAGITEVSRRWHITRRSSATVTVSATVTAWGAGEALRLAGGGSLGAEGGENPLRSGKARLAMLVLVLVCRAGLAQEDRPRGIRMTDA